MQLFYAPEITEGSCTLSPEESKHIVRVLRKKAGDELLLTDGRGTLHTVRILADDPRGCLVESVSQEPRPALPYTAHIAVAPTKNLDRIEWFTEKATEIGISEISPVICDRSERHTVKEERLEKMAVSAMKQSLKAWLPRINAARSFREFAEQDFGNAKKFIAHCETGEKPHLKELVSAGDEAVVLIGPEGDFSPEEIRLALSHGFREISLGESRLRTETAALYALSVLSLA